jgi:hypothetical protein
LPTPVVGGVADDGYSNSYYCLYSLYNKIRDKGKIVSAGY